MGAERGARIRADTQCITARQHVSRRPTGVGPRAGVWLWVRGGVDGGGWRKARGKTKSGRQERRCEAISIEKGRKEVRSRRVWDDGQRWLVERVGAVCKQGRGGWPLLGVGAWFPSSFLPCALSAALLHISLGSRASLCFARPRFAPPSLCPFATFSSSVRLLCVSAKQRMACGLMCSMKSRCLCMVQVRPSAGWKGGTYR